MKFFPLSGICDVMPSSILSSVLILMCIAEFTVPLLSHMQSDHSDPLSSSGEMEITQQGAMIYGNILNDWPSICSLHLSIVMH